MDPLDNNTIYISGSTTDNSRYISGFVSTSNLAITIASMETDEIILVSSIPPEPITYWDIMGRLLPGICVLFFFGFGNIYKQRFWSQYSQMNTYTLKKRINEAKSNNK